MPQEMLLAELVALGAQDLGSFRRDGYLVWPSTFLSSVGSAAASAWALHFLSGFLTLCSSCIEPWRCLAADLSRVQMVSAQWSCGILPVACMALSVIASPLALFSLSFLCFCLP